MANGGSIRYSVGFDVDKSGLSQLKASLQEIQKLTAQDLMKINNSSLETANKDLIKLRSSIGEIDKALDKAFNSDLGTLNVTKFNSELKKMNLNQIYSDFSKAGAAGQAAFRNTTTQILTTNMQLKKTHNLLDEMATTMSNTIKWGIASSVMNNLTGSVKKAYGYVKSLDTSLNDIRIVTEKSAEQMDKFAVKANNAAKALGQSTTDYTEASLIYYQQGLSDKEVEARTETTLKAANVTGQSGEEVSEQLTAVWNGYKVSAEEAEIYVDKLAAVAASTASNLEELSTGMSKVASAANAMGVDVDQLNAQLATIVSVTRQAPESVGTALKTIYARMSDLKMGKTDEDGLGLGDVSGTMEQMGIKILDETGNLRDMGKVVEDVAAKWDTWTKAQQTAMAQVMAGKRQYNNLVALFENWDMYEEALSTSENSLGTLQRQQDTYMESTAAHLQQMRTSFEDLYDSMLDESTINGFADIISFTVDRFTDLVDGIGGGSGALLSFGSIAGRVFSKQIAQGIATTITNFRNAKENAAQLQAQMELLGQYKGLDLQDNTTQKLIKWKEEIINLGSLVTNEQHNEANAIIQSTNQIQNEADAWEENKRKAEEYLKTTNISKKPITGISQEDNNYKQIQGELKKQVDFYIEAEEKAKECENAIKEFNTALYEQSEAANDTAYDSDKMTQADEKLKEAVEKTTKAIEEQGIVALSEGRQNRLLALNGECEEYIALKKAVEEYNEALSKKDTISEDKGEIQKSAEKLVQAYQNANIKLRQQAEQTRGIVKRESEGATQDFQNSLQQAERTWNNFISNLKVTQQIQQVVKLTSSIGQLASVINTLINIGDIISDDSLSNGEKALKIISALTMAIPMLISGLGGVGNSLIKLASLSNAKVASSIAEITAESAGAAGGIKALGLSIQTLATGPIGIILGIAAALTAVGVAAYKAYNKEKDALANATTAVQNQTEALDRLKAAQDAVNDSVSAYEEARKQVDSLVEGTQEWRDATNEANEAVLNLLDKYPELASEIENVNGALKISKEGLELVQNLSAKAVNQAQGDLYLAQANKLSKENDYKTVSTGRSIQYTTAGGQQLTVADSTIDTIVSKINESGSSFLENAETLQDELGTTNTALIDALLETDNKEELIQLANEVAANTAAIQIYNQQAADSYLQDDEAYQNATEEQKAIIDKIAGEKLGAETEKLYEQKYKDGAGMFDKDIQKQYAELLGIDPNQTKNKSKNIGEYFIDGEWQQISDETARMALAANEASKCLDGLSEGVIKASNSIGQIDGMTDNIQNAALGFANGGSGDLSELNFNELAQLGNIEFTDEIAQQLGFEGENPAKDYMEAIDNAISKELKNRADSLQEELKNAPNIIAENLNGVMNLEELKTFNEAGGIDMSAINPDMLNSMLEEGLSLEEVFNEIDWSSIDPSKPTEWFKSAFEKAIEDASYSKGNEADVEANYENDAEQYDFDEEVYRDTTKLIQEMAEASDELADSLKDQEDSAQEVAKDLLRYDKAIESIKENSEDWLKALKSGNVQDIGENMNDIAAAYGNLLDIDASKLSNDFLQSTKNMEDLQAAANGSEEAYNRLAEAARQDMAAKIGFDDTEFQAGFQDLMNKYYEGQNLDDLEVGANLNNEDFLNGLTEMINAAGMTADEATDYLSSMGIDAEVETDTVTTPETSTVIKGYKPKLTWGSHNVDLGPLGNFNMSVPQLEFDTITETVQTDKQIAANALKVTSATKSSGGAFKYKNSSHGSGNKGSSGGKKGGGGGGKGGGGGGSKTSAPKKEDPLKEKIDRYHDVNTKLKQVKEELDDLDKVQDKLFGADLIKNLNKQLDILEKQRDVYKEKLKIAKAEQQELQNALKKEGVAFNNDGTIKNYMQILQAKQDEINRLINQYNGMSAEAQDKFKEETLDPAKKSYDEFKEKLENYDDLILDTIPEIENALDDIVDREVEINIQKLNMEVELRLDLTEAQKDWNEFKRKIIDGIKDDDIFGNAMSNTELFKKVLENGTIEAGTKNLNTTMAEIAKINAGGVSDIFGEDKAAAMENLEEQMSNLMGHLEDLADIEEEISEAYLDMIDEVGDAFDEQIESYEYVGDLINHNMNLIKLIKGDDAYAELETFYKQQEKNNLDLIKSQKAAVDYYKQMMETETDPEAIEKWTELWKDSLSDLNGMVENSVENIIDKYANTINAIFDELNDKVTNGMGLDYLTQEWELKNDNADQYLDTINSTYEVQKLEKKIRDSINNTDSISAQRQLNKLMDDELKKLREKDKLTQYDIDRANAKYELKLKEIALEEAQQNKTQMRLRRDASGNYSYQFVADQDSISQAQQELDEARNSLYNMDRDEYRENQQAILDIYREFQEKMRDSANMSAEERELIEQEYTTRINNLLEENGVIRTNLMESAFADMAALYGMDVSNFQEMSQVEQDILMGQIVPNWDSGVQAMIDKMVGEGGFGPTCEEAMINLKIATDEYDDSLKQIEETAGISFGAIEEGYDTNIQLAEELAQAQQENIDRTIEEKDAIGELKMEVDALKSSYDAVYEAAKNALEAAQKVREEEARKAAEEAAREAAKNATANGGSGSGGSGSGSGGSSSNNGKTTLTSDIIDGVSGALYYWTPAGWGTGNTRRQRMNEKFGSGAYDQIQSYINQHVTLSGGLKKPFRYGWGDRDKYKAYYYSKFDTGGYTGDWLGDDGKAAILHKKELVLNKDDTKNILSVVNIVRGMQGIISAMNDSMISRTSAMTSSLVPNTGFEAGQSDLNQNVRIEASFPGVSSRAEIEQAFENLVNMASQHAYNTQR